MASERPILLVEDNPDDEALTLRAFNKNRIATPLNRGSVPLSYDRKVDTRTPPAHQ